MSSRFILPFADVGSGIKPSSGAKLFFFELDGVTPKDTFSDQLSTPTPNTNPVTSDSNGVFGDIYIVGQYKVTLQNKNGSQIFGGAIVEEFASFADLSLSYEFDTVADFKASDIEFPDNKKITLKGRLTIGDGFGGDYIKLTGTGTANTHNIIASTSVNQSISLIITDEINIGQWLDSPIGAETALPIADALGKKIIIDTTTQVDSSLTINSDVEFTVKGIYQTNGVNPDPNVEKYTFNGNVTAPRSEIFTGNGDIELKGSMRVVYPEWFGIFNEVNGNDGLVDLDSNTRRAGRCVGDSQCAIEFGNGLYYIRDFLIDQSNSGIIGQGKDNTFLKNAPVNNVSTRFGVQLTIYGPNTSLNPDLGNRDWISNITITDCYMKDFTVIWDDDATVSTDPQMNGVAVLGCQGFVVENVHSTIPTGQRAFAVQTNDQDQKTEDGLVTRCSSTGSISGIYISEGFVSNANKSFKNIQVIDNHFSVRLVASNESLGPSSPILLHGFEVPANIDAGKILIKGNHCEGGAKGVHTQSPDVGKKFNSQVTIEDNSFENFREHGILSYIENMEILRNEFDSTSVQTNAIQAGGVVLYTNSEGGALKNTIRGNTFKNLSGSGTIYGVHIRANEGCEHLIDDNWFKYEDGMSPAYDVFFLDVTGILGDVKLSNNKFFDTGAANVRGTTVNMEMLFWDLGGNQGMNLFNGEIHGVRFGTPTDSRYYKRGTYLSFGIATFTAGTQVGFICTADHKPTAAGTWKNVIG